MGHSGDYWVLEPKWSRANCLDVPDTVFFPDKLTAARVLGARMFYCRTCPVAEDCIRRFLDEEDGIFAGTTPKERTRLRVVQENAGEGAFKRHWVDVLESDQVDQKAQDWL